MELTNEQKTLSNNKFQSKLSYHRRELKDFLQQTKDFFSDNFDYAMPDNKKAFYGQITTSKQDDLEKREFVKDNYSYLVDSYYRLKNFGQSFGSLFKNDRGDYETYTLAHIYSKHRLDPVWNYRKSNLIRKIYRNYLSTTNLHKEYTPCHLVLTLPHQNGTYEGKKFYAKELIEKFHELRRKPFFRDSVYAGEYGIEVKESKNKANGLHIHLHSLIFVKKKTGINWLRKYLEYYWELSTGATQLWLETIYYFKKDEQGKYITQLKEKIDTTEETEDGDYLTNSKFELVKKKFYVTDLENELKLRKDLTEEEKETELLNCYIYGILECIKYHFKNDSLKDQNGNYNFELIEEILRNTKGKRLYSRFGAFYKVKELCFNKLEKDDEPMAEVIDEVINPFTHEAVESEKTEIVMFYPEQQIRAKKTDKTPYKLINYKTDIYESVGSGNIKLLLSNYFKEKFKKPPKDINKLILKI